VAEPGETGPDDSDVHPRVTSQKGAAVPAGSNCSCLFAEADWLMQPLSGARTD